MLKKKNWSWKKGVKKFKGFRIGKLQFAKSNFRKPGNFFSKEVFKQQVKNKPFAHYVRPAPIDKRFNLCLWIRQTYNNIFLTVTDSKGRVRFVISGGSTRLRGNNRASHRSVEIIMRVLMRKLQRIKIKRLEFKTLCVFLVTPKNSVIKSLLRLLVFIPKVKFIAARLRIPHNGIRSKKLRRL